MKKIRYKLYAMCPEDGDNVVEKEKYTRRTSRYVLVYKRGKKPKNSVMVEDLSALSDDDKAWLERCNLELLHDFVESHHEAAMRGTADFVNRFQKELEKEQEKMRKEGAEYADD